MSGIPRPYRQPDLIDHITNLKKYQYETSTALTIENAVLLPLLDDWYAYPAEGTDFASGATMRKNRFGMVTLEGLIFKATGVSSNDDIAALPEGYRPDKTKIVLASIYTASGGAAIARIDIMPDGIIEYNGIYAGGAASGAVSFLSLDNIHFYAVSI